MGRREDKKAETRRRLINAALDVFAEHGYAGASLDDVSETAGLTKGAVYSNFASKADLALAVLDRRIDAPLAIFEQVDPSVSTSEQLRVGGEMLARSCVSATGSCVMLSERALPSMPEPPVTTER
jgi:AcrR family transcriptional regulator